MEIDTFLANKSLTMTDGASDTARLFPQTVISREMTWSILLSFGLIACLCVLKDQGRFVALALGTRAVYNSDKRSAPRRKNNVILKETQVESTFQQPSARSCNSQLDEIKLLYHKLHQLERNTEILPLARDTLLRLLSESLQAASRLTVNNILSINDYDRDTVRKFIDGVNGYFCDRLNEYDARRRAGGSREMFTTRQECIEWLKQQAPVKLVDGSWLGHIDRICAAEETRKAAQCAWQVMSEELGDGDLARNHAYLYQKLLLGLGVSLPAADDRDFVHPRHGLNDIGSWRAAVSQLLISLFPKDFFPEILGFNLHFELISWETILCTKELRELNIDDYYFVLHVSIDNAHSGHTAMATKIVTDYMDSIVARNTPEEAREIWKRVQAGYTLSQCVSMASSTTRIRELSPNIWNAYAEDTSRLFQAKSLISRQLHCTSKAKIGGYSLVEWMEADSMRNVDHARCFLESLGRSRTWVIPGNSDRSRLVQTLSWGGRMFGAFSDKEMKILRGWIDHMLPIDAASLQKFYYQYTGRNMSDLSSISPHQQDILVDYPVFHPSMDKTLVQWLSRHPDSTRVSTANVCLKGEPNLNRLLPLWYAQTALLEGIISIPIRTCNLGTSALLRVVRAQRGFGNLDLHGGSCAGMDELQGSEPRKSLAYLGAMMASGMGNTHVDVQQAFATSSDSSAATRMLHLSMRPIRHEASLVGMSWAFASLHQQLVALHADLLPDVELEALSKIAQDEMQGIRIWLDQVQEPSALKLWSQGFEAAKAEIEACFDVRMD